MGLISLTCNLKIRILTFTAILQVMDEKENYLIRRIRELKTFI